MHIEKEMKEVFYFVSDDGLKKSEYKHEIEEYEDMIKTNPMNAFKCIMTFSLDDQEYDTYRIKTQKEFKVLLFTLGFLYSRDRFKPEMYELTFNQSYLFYTIIYNKTTRFISIEPLNQVISNIEINMRGNSEREKNLDKIKRWEQLHVYLARKEQEIEEELDEWEKSKIKEYKNNPNISE